MAGFCRRCGDIIRGSDSRCKCGGSSASSQVTKAMFETTDGSPKHDRWLKTYGERRSVSPASALASRSQSKPPPPSQLQNVCLPSPEILTQPLVPAPLKTRQSLGDRSLNIMPAEAAAPPLPQEPISEPIVPKEVKRGLSVKSSARAHVRSLTANMPDSVGLSAAEEEVLTNVFGSVLDPHETRGRCGACQQIFKREGKIYPDPRREDESGKWAGVFYCRKCYVQRFSRGKCASCQHTIVGDEGTFIQLGKEGCNGLWHKKCFKCVHCQTDVSNSPSVDLSGNPCCDECFEKPQPRNSKSSMVTDIPDLRVQPLGYTRIKRTSINNSPAAQNIKPAVDELRNKLRKAGIEKEPARPSIPSSVGAVNNTRSQPKISIPASATPAVFPTSVKPLSIVKPTLQALKPDALRNPTSTSFKSSPKLGSTAVQHVLSPSANPLCPTCKLSLFRPSLTQPSPGNSDGGAAERIGGTLATLPATGETFHVHCLSCDDCKQPFPNQKYVLLNNLKLCERCVAQRDMVAAQEKFEKMSAEFAKRRDDSVSTRFPDYQKSKANKEWHLAHSESVSPSFPSTQSFQSSTSPYNSKYQPNTSAPMAKSASENPQLLKKVSNSPFLGGQDSSSKIPSSMTKSLSATRFGGQSICPGCSKPGTITETKLGPNGLRWHFKCLRCAECHKPLDSGAKTFDNSTAVGCRDCLGNARAKKRASGAMQLR
ncbi:hypothetical protein PTTG_12339 [Puccinia triticina 1-1 BBBD Race 1]|uniref:LIM zinc-binding domain-containing protein n=2 Tax=Puccinia triticina TaxID=208348 RepID=A0A180GUH8_PUCT1|nr:uncharacterized protein PtA15_3A663 [Puccinia triticina]OAV96457.1 hypothetical protein PTTG_12339 [Puccinia triticina 1-1 BBBD Race 1]WAQ83294.1 hypothetical protein PtA15_3A663 [Puccinia triticina]WAR54143.1 hypothetical protein PtB15_3B655 [Puccinia triticina]